jgi:hypothetical protein
LEVFVKKKLLTIVLPLFLVVACSLGVWANEQSAAQPGCDKCPKVAKTAPCDNCPKDVTAAQGCDNCAKMKAAYGKPAGDKGCEKCAKCEKQVLEGKAGCNKGCDNCAKMKVAEVKPSADEAQQAVKKPCCDKSKPE